MYKKNCFRCKQPSFSSAKDGIWVCPTCQTNLARVVATDAEERGKRAPMACIPLSKAKYQKASDSESIYDELI